MDDRTPVTVGIPAYNAASFIQRAVDSVRAQSWPIAEVLVVDDGSKDDTAAAAERLGCRVVRHQRNKGDPGARNTLLANAATPYVAMLDADDEWLSHHLETVVPLLVGHPHRAAAFGLARYVPSGLTWPMPRPAGAGPDLLAVALHRAMIPHNAVVLRVAHVQSVGGYREHLRHASDYDLWCRLAARYDIAGVEQYTAIIHQHAQQSSRKGMEYHATEYDIRREFLASAAFREQLGVSEEWLRNTNYQIWRDHLNATWHSRDIRNRLWHLGQYRDHGRASTFLSSVAGIALMPVARLRDRLRQRGTAA
jgi:glycosyltransferase involved in cell wall biosynthesis